MISSSQNAVGKIIDHLRNQYYIRYHVRYKLADAFQVGFVLCVCVYHTESSLLSFRFFASDLLFILSLKASLKAANASLSLTTA